MIRSKFNKSHTSISSGKCSNLGQPIKKIEKLFAVSQKHICLKIVLCIYLKNNVPNRKHQSVFIFLQSRLIFPILNQLSFFLFRKIFVSFVTLLTLFIILFFRRTSIFFPSILMLCLCLFCFSLLQKDLHAFHELKSFSLLFFCFFDKIHPTFLYLTKNLKKN